MAPMRLNPDLPVKLEKIITKALERNRKFRYRGAQTSSPSPGA